jgi:hypothetical protein
MRATDSFVASNISASSPAFSLHGGLYAITAVATWNSSGWTLQRYAADGTTLVTVMTEFTANFYGTIDLPYGKYILTMASGSPSVGYIEIVRVPGE